MKITKIKVIIALLFVVLTLANAIVFMDHYLTDHKQSLRVQVALELLAQAEKYCKVDQAMLIQETDNSIILFCTKKEVK